MKSLVIFANSENGIALVFCISTLSFLLTLFVAFRTFRISFIIKKNNEINEYNSNKIELQEKINVYRLTILNDSITNRRFVSDVVTLLYQIQNKYSTLMNLKDKFQLLYFIRYLKKIHNKLDFNKIANYLSQMIGRLEKKGELKI